MTIWVVLKFFHFAALALICLSLGALCVIDRQRQPIQYKAMMKCHGSGLIIVFITGIALVKYMHFPISEMWLWSKVAVWLLLGMLPMLLFKLALLSEKFNRVQVKVYIVLLAVAIILFLSTTRLML